MKKKLLQSILISISLVVFLQTGVTAMSVEQRRLIDSGVYYFDLEQTPATCASGQGVPLVGGDNTEQAWHYLASRGLQPHQVGGIIGNLLGESGLIPNRRQGNGVQTISSFSEVVPDVGFGIAQWTTAGRQQAWGQFAISSGRDPLSLDLQLDYLMHELETNAGFGLEHLRQATDLRQATWIFLSFFERPSAVIRANMAANPTQPQSGSAFEALNERVALAQPAFDTYAGVSVSTSCSTAPGSDTSMPDFTENPSVQIDEGPRGSHHPSNCTGSLTIGASSLREVIMQRWSPPVTSIGGYSCRAIVGSSGTSVHGVGRALDIMVDATTPDGLATGDEIRNWLINNASTLGIQRVIWNRHVWQANRSGWSPYTGSNPHIDHVHAEINIQASTNETLGR